jgi:hypothetical protein
MSKLQASRVQAYATFGLLRSTLPAHCDEAARPVNCNRKTHASETGQRSSSFGFVGEHMAISANEPMEDIPCSGCGLPIRRVRHSFGSRETSHRRVDRKFLDEIVRQQNQDAGAISAPGRNIGTASEIPLSHPAALRAELVVNSAIVRRGELVVHSGVVKRSRPSITTNRQNSQAAAESGRRLN